MTTPPFKDAVSIRYVRIPMRDGVELAAKITRPSADGEYPAVMEYNPYRRQKKPRPSYRDEYPPLVPYLAERGYAIVQFDVRGTGNSGGWTTDIYCEEEQRDAYEMVEWIARQRWCNGNVGMFGKSYSGVVQWQVAVQAPPALKAIIVRSANDDVYTEWVYPGGCMRPYMFDLYSSLMNAFNFAPPDPDVVGEKWSEIWNERLENSGPWGIGYISHPVHGKYWSDRSLSADYERVKCAVFVVAGWSDVYPTALLRAYSKLKVPKKALVGPWGHWYAEEKMAVPGPRIDSRVEYLNWFDYWLKEIDNGVMDEPPVTLFIRKHSPPDVRMPLEEPGYWRSEREWPLLRSESRVLHFQADAGLGAEPEANDAGSDEIIYNPGAGVTSGIHWGGGVLPWGMPIDQRQDDAFSLIYTSEPLENDLEVTGNPRAVLFASSTATVAYFRVKLIDVTPDGTAKLVRYGGLNATHRHSHVEPEPLVPAEVYELDVELKAMAYVFQAGHRIRVAVSCADFQNAWPTSKRAANTIHRGAGGLSRIELPVVPPQQPLLPEPPLVKLPPADPTDLQAPTEYSITQDLLNKTTVMRMATDVEEPGTKQCVRSCFTVSSENPAQATLQASAVYTLDQAGMTITIEADEVTASDADTFRHVVTVDVSVNGKQHFTRNWSVTVPRMLN